MDDTTGWSPELGVVQVAAPCPARWEEMTGDARSRFCGKCRLHVYDLSAMTSDEARALLLEREGRLCVRFYRRADGRLLTRDCPRGLGARLRRRWAAAVAMVLAMFGASRLQWKDDAAPAGPPPPCPIPHAAEAKRPTTQPDDEQWMRDRRSRTGPRETIPNTRTIVGVLRTRVEVIRSPKS